MDIKSTVTDLLARPEVQARIAAVKTQITNEETKRQIVDDLYDMLPRPVRWVLAKDAFEVQVRRHVFREMESGDTNAELSAPIADAPRIPPTDAVEKS
jgi:hypothetical protein